MRDHHWQAGAVCRSSGDGCAEGAVFDPTTGPDSGRALRNSAPRRDTGPYMRTASGALMAPIPASSLSTTPAHASRSVGGFSESHDMTAQVWTDELKDYLRAAWDAGMTASEIAAALGDWCNKNKVIGAVHRMGLPLRESPIKRLYGPPTSHWMAKKMRDAEARALHTWTDAKCETLRTMRQERKTWPEIAAAIGVSFKAAQQKAARMGVPPLPVIPAPLREPPTPRPVARPVYQPAVSVSPFPHCQYVTNDERPYLWCDADPVVVVNEIGRVCSASYCKEHYELCYTPYRGRGDMTPWLRGKV
jgi:hypothetical protein